MNIYLFLIWLVFVIIFFQKISNKKILILFIIIPMFFSLATQVNIGTDYYTYIKIFKYGSTRIEKGYLLFSEFLKYLSKDERILFVGISLLQMILFYILLLKYQKIEKLKKIPFYVLVLCTSTNSYMMMFNGLRSSIAALFFNLSLIFYLEKKYILTIILIILGGNFHTSIYFAVGIIFLLSKLLKKEYCGIVILTSLILCFLINKLELIKKGSEIIYNLNLDFYYKNYLVSKHMFNYVEGLGIGTIINFLFCLLAGALYKKIIENKKNIFLYNLGFLGIGLKFLFAGIPILSRMLEYFNIAQALVIYSFLNLTLKKKYFYIGIIILLFYLLQTIVGVERMLEFNKLKSL